MFQLLKKWFSANPPSVADISMRALPVDLTNNGPANTPAQALRCFSRLHRLRLALAKELEQDTPSTERLMDLHSSIEIYRTKLISAGYTIPDEDDRKAWIILNDHHGVI